MMLESYDVEMVGQPPTLSVNKHRENEMRRFMNWYNLLHLKGLYGDIQVSNNLNPYLTTIYKIVIIKARANSATHKLNLCFTLVMSTQPCFHSLLKRGANTLIMQINAMTYKSG